MAYYLVSARATGDLMALKARLDSYFSDITTERIDEGQGWSRIDHLPSLWRSPPTQNAGADPRQESP